MLFVKRVTNYSEFAVENFYGWLPELHFIRITKELTYITYNYISLFQPHYMYKECSG